MQRERLTPERIRRFTLPAGKSQGFLWDTVAPRLAVRATAGVKSFVFEAKLNGQTIRRTIGDAFAWNIDDARAEANRLQTMIDQGIDPRELDRQRAADKAAAKAAQEAATREADERRRYTLGALVEAYAEHLDRAGKARSAAGVRSLSKCHIGPEIACTPARNVTPHQVAALVRKVRETGKERTAGVLRSTLLAAFNAAKRAPFDSVLPADLIAFAIEHNPADPIPAIPVQRGSRTLSADELREYMHHLNTGAPDLAAQALLLSLLAGGQRMTQQLRAKVSDFDPDTATLRLWDGKGKRTQPREHLLPLAPRAAALVAGLVDRANGMETPYLFSTHGRAPLRFETAGVRAGSISASMGGEPFTLRDIRRTCETMLAGMGISKDTRAQLLSHGISGVQAAHYDRHSYTDEKRAALVAWEAKLEAIARGEKPSANVRQIRRKNKTAA